MLQPQHGQAAAAVDPHLMHSVVQPHAGRRLALLEPPTALTHEPGHTVQLSPTAAKPLGQTTSPYTLLMHVLIAVRVRVQSPRAPYMII